MDTFTATYQRQQEVAQRASRVSQVGHVCAASATQALLQHVILLLEILDNVQLMAVDPTCAAELDDQRDLLGQLLETFVFGEIEKQASAHPERISLHHLRDKDGYEVDIVVQRGTHHASIEVKAASSVREGDENPPAGGRRH
jgi:hypothetical protein